MSQETQQWIPLTGPNGRKPTQIDADENRRVWYAIPGRSVAQFRYWNDVSIHATHFLPGAEFTPPQLPEANEIIK